jgi:hypothetical protein
MQSQKRMMYPQLKKLSVSVGLAGKSALNFIMILSCRSTCKHWQGEAVS